MTIPDNPRAGEVLGSFAVGAGPTYWVSLTRHGATAYVTLYGPDGTVVAAVRSPHGARPSIEYRDPWRLNSPQWKRQFASGVLGVCRRDGDRAAAS